MAIDTAKKRRAVAGVPFSYPSVTPDAAQDELWRASAAGGFDPDYTDSLPSVIACSAAVGSQLEAFETVTAAYAVQVAGNERAGASLQAPGYAGMTGVCFRLGKTNSPTGAIKVIVHTDDGGNELYDDPPDFVGPEYDIESIAGSPEWYFFPINVNLSSYTNIFLALQVDGGDASNYVNIYGDAGAGDADAVGALINLPSTVVGGSYDIAFRLYGNIGGAGPRSRRGRRRYGGLH